MAPVRGWVVVGVVVIVKGDKICMIFLKHFFFWASTLTLIVLSSQARSPRQQPLPHFNKSKVDFYFKRTQPRIPFLPVIDLGAIDPTFEKLLRDKVDYVYAHEDAQLQGWVDRALTDIIQTKKGTQIYNLINTLLQAGVREKKASKRDTWGMMSNRFWLMDLDRRNVFEGFLHYFLGISTEGAQELRKNLGKPQDLYNDKDVRPNLFPVNYLKLIGNLPLLPKYYIFFFGQTQFPYYAWTFHYHQTCLFLNREDTDFLPLVQILTHELAVLFDFKSVVSQMWLKYYFNSRWKIESELPEREIWNSVTRGAIRIAFMSLRAFRWEKEVLGELQAKYAFELPAFYSQFEIRDVQSCQKAVENVIQSQEVFARFADRMNIVTGINGFFLEALGDQIIIDLNRDKNWKKDLQKVMSATLVDNKSGERKSLCEWLATPELGPLYKMLENGPRPRMGGGGWGH
ncbi:MAG: hypothetical protein WCG27_04300 [Pseudomonadota bacterium]